MSYDYKAEREYLFTDEGQRIFLAVRDKAFALLRVAGAVRLYAIKPDIGCYTSFQIMACVERMIELGELRWVEKSEDGYLWQNSILVSVK